MKRIKYYFQYLRKMKNSNSRRRYARIHKFPILFPNQVLARFFFTNIQNDFPSTNVKQFETNPKNVGDRFLRIKKEMLF